MSIASRANRSSRLVIVLQLIAWSAVSIVLLQKGVTSLQRRILEANQVTETYPSIGEPSTESGASRSAENRTRQSTDRFTKLIIQFNPELAGLTNRNRSGSNVIKSELGDEFEIISAERRTTLSSSSFLETPTTDPETLNSSPIGNRLSKLDDRDSDGKIISNGIFRTIHDKIIGHRLSANIHAAKEDVRSSEESVSESVSKEEGENLSHVGREDIDFTESTSLSTTAPSLRGISDDQTSTTNSFRRRKMETPYTGNINSSGATIAIAMIAIGTIMLLLGPAVIILRLLNETIRTGKSHNESSDDAAWREDLPPAYEQVILMNEVAPRYSTLILNGRGSDDIHLSPPLTFSPSASPSPSPSASPSPSPLPR